MPQDFTDPRLRPLAADLARRPSRGSGGADLNAELKRRVREDLEKPCARWVSSAKNRRSGGAGRALEQGRRPMSTDTSLRCNQRLLA